MNKNKKAVTLVEIIIVGTILSIISVFGLLYYNSYLVTVRDSSRLVELENIETSLGAYVFKSGFYPEPSDGQNITFSGSVVWTQGTFGESVQNIIGYSKNVLDPLTQNEYTYSVKNTKKEYSLAGILEERPGLVASNNIITSANAEELGSKKGIALVKGNYNGEVVSVRVNGVTNILALPSIISTNLSSLNLLDIINNNRLVYNDYGNIPASYTGSVFQLDSGIDFSSNQLVIFTGSVSDLKVTYNQIGLLQKLHSAYSGSILGKNISASKIDFSDLYSPEPSNKVKDLACDLINFKLKYFVECGGVDFITFFVVNVLHIDISKLPGTKITVVYQDHNGNFVFGTNGGLAFFDGTNWLIYTKATSGLINNNITSITQDNSGKYWIGTTNKISKLDIGDYINKGDDIWITYGSSVLVGTHVQYIYTDNDGVVWIGTNQGVTSYNGDIWASYTKDQNGLSHNNITAIYTDSQGHFWFGTNSKGVDKFSLSDENCISFWRGDGDDDEDDHDGHDDDHDGNDEDHHCHHQLHDDHHDDEDGDDDEDDEYDGNSDTVINYNSGKLPNQKVNYIFEDSTGKMWIGTDGGIGVSPNYGTTWYTYTNSNTSGGLVSNIIEYLFEDSAGNIWVGTTSGVSKFNGTTWTKYSTSEALSHRLLSNNVFLINQDGNGNIIIFSEGGLDTINSSGEVITGL